MSKLPRLAALVLCAALAPWAASARCLPFKLVQSTAQVPYIVHGKVTQSNKAELAAARCDPDLCRHRFQVQVIEVLKGRVNTSTLQVQYDFVHQREEIKLFADGDEFVFAVRKLAPDGRATLLGTSCGRAGADVGQLDPLRQVLKRR